MSGEAPTYGEWQPIETAPRDGTVVFAHVPAYTFHKGKRHSHIPAKQVLLCWVWAEDVERPSGIAFRAQGLIEKHGGFFAYAGSQKAVKGLASHWMPLPEPPA
jgi:hypothetical protein